MKYKVDYKIVECMQKKNSCYKKAQKCTKKGIIRHNTGAGNKYLKRYVEDPERLGVNKYGNHWNQRQTGKECKMVHYFIGLDKNDVVRIYHIMPDNYYCWGNAKHPNTGRTCNGTHIQYEICDDDFKDKDYFEATHEAARYLEAYLCVKHGWSSNVIMSHWESYLHKCGSAHGDDDDWLRKFGTNMNNERKLVQKKINEMKKPKKPTNPATKEAIKGESEKDRFIRTFGYWCNKDLGTSFENKPQFDKLKEVIAKNNLVKGSKHKGMVEHLQYWIVKLGIAKIDVDGSFGDATFKAVKKLQEKCGCKQDGEFGSGTLEKMVAKLFK